MKHRRLNSSRKEFRLLELQAAQSVDDQVVCRLVTVSLTNDLEFIALSSLYGDPNETDKIIVNGQALTVTKHLAQALKHVRTVFFPTMTRRQQPGPQPQEKKTPRWLQHLLRHVGTILPDPDREATTPLRLWMDALCIDQTDESEKLNQVIGMAQVYASAKMVVGWLGLKIPESDAGLAAFKEIDEAMPPTWGDAGDRELHPEQYSPHHEWLKKTIHMWVDRPDGRPAYYGEHWVGASDFYNRPYFQRRWILEEMAMARFPAFLLGDTIVSWKLVLRVNRFMEEFKEAESNVFDKKLRKAIVDLPLGTVHVMLDELVRRRRLEGRSMSDNDGSTMSIASGSTDK